MQPEPEQVGSGAAPVADGSEALEEVKHDAKEGNVAVEQLKQIIASRSITEENGKLIFDRYDTAHQGLWTFSNVREFLLDLQAAFGYPRLVPDEAVADVVQELQLNGEGAGKISWIEFKSYLIYLQQTPFEQLHSVVNNTLAAVQLPNGVYVDSLPKSITRDYLVKVFSACGTVASCFLVEEGEHIKTQSLVTFTEAGAVEKAVALNGTTLIDTPVHVAIYTQPQFPVIIRPRNPSAVAKGLASVVLGANAVDDKLHLTATLKKGGEAIAQSMSSFSEKHKLKEKMHVAGELTTGTVHAIDQRLSISSTLDSVDKKLNISTTAKQVGERISTSAPVQMSLGLLSSLASKVTAAVDELKQDTKAVIVEKEAKKAPPKAAEVELAAEQPAAAQPAAVQPAQPAPNSS